MQRYLLYSALGCDWVTLVAKLLSITDSAYELATYLAEVTTAVSLPRGSSSHQELDACSRYGIDIETTTLETSSCYP